MRVCGIGADIRRALRHLVVAALLLFPLAAPLDAATISGIDVADDRITLSFDRGVTRASAFLLDGPRRIAIDVTGASPGGAPDDMRSAAGGIVSAVRMAQYDPATARVVLDLARPAVLGDGVLAPDGRSLTLSMRPVDPLVFRGATKEARRTFVTEADFRTRGPAADRSSVRIPLDAPSAPDGVPIPPVSGARGTNRPLVVIDAGHGGHDPGASSPDGRLEKDAALAIARAIRNELVSSGRVRVALTRSDDRFLVLGERREIARRLHADLFISIHCDSAPNDAARGATIYTLSEVASDRVAAQLAQRENRADVLNGVNLGEEASDVSSILFDLAQRETMNVSADFASLLQRELSDRIAFRTNFHRFAGLVVLKAPDVPSILLETGYISNPDDVKLLFSRDYQHDIAVGVRRAVETHFARRLAGN